MAEINGQRKEQIKKEAKQILDNFASSLEKVELKKKKSRKEVGGFREESSGRKNDADFRRIMFENAPHKDESNIITEKKSW